MTSDRSFLSLIPGTLLYIAGFFTLIGLLALPLWQAALFGLASAALCLIGLVLILPLMWLADWIYWH